MGDNIGRILRIFKGGHSATGRTTISRKRGKNIREIEGESFETATPNLERPTRRSPCWVNARRQLCYAR